MLHSAENSARLHGRYDHGNWWALRVANNGIHGIHICADLSSTRKDLPVDQPRVQSSGRMREALSRGNEVLCSPPAGAHFTNDQWSEQPKGSRVETFLRVYASKRLEALIIPVQEPDATVKADAWRCGAVTGFESTMYWFFSVWKGHLQDWSIEFQK